LLRVVFGDLAVHEAEAVLRPIRSDLAPVNALSRDLGSAGGEVLESRLSNLGSIPLGGAVITPGGDLAADFVIHVVVMSEDEPQSLITIQRALRNGLRRAADWEISSLAVPPLGLGVGSMEAESAAQALVDVLCDHLAGGDPPSEVTVVVTSEYEAALFSRLVAERQPDPSS